jgi:hypothetical protein
MAGLESPDSGQVRLDGLDLSTLGDPAPSTLILKVCSATPLSHTTHLPDGARVACSARSGCALPDARSRCARMRAITPGSSMLATIFSRAPQRAAEEKDRARLMQMQNDPDEDVRRHGRNALARLNARKGD